MQSVSESVWKSNSIISRFIPTMRIGDEILALLGLTGVFIAKLYRILNCELSAFLGLYIGTHNNITPVSIWGWFFIIYFSLIHPFHYFLEWLQWKKDYILVRGIKVLTSNAKTLSPKAQVFIVEFDRVDLVLVILRPWKSKNFSLYCWLIDWVDQC